MSCPDNLLIGQRKGVLGSEDSARLDAHLRQCPSCRLSLRVGQDFDQALQTLAGDELIAARFARNLGPRLAKQQRTRRGVRVHYAWVAAAALAIATSAGLAAAATLGAWPFAPRALPQETQTPKRARAAQAPARPAPIAPPSAEATPPEEPAASVARVPSASELFTQANARRRAGEPSRAQRLYRELQQRYPHSPEVEVSYVSLGRVQLELGDAHGALEQFARYLTRQPRGDLAEEALFGKARALERLGRAADEQNTWRALIAAFPGSLYAERARLRLQVLAAPGARQSTP